MEKEYAAKEQQRGAQLQALSQCVRHRDLRQPAFAFTEKSYTHQKEVWSFAGQRRRGWSGRRRFPRPASHPRDDPGVCAIRARTRAEHSAFTPEMRKRLSRNSSPSRPAVGTRAAAPDGLLAVLRAFVAGGPRFDPSTLRLPLMKGALRRGLGPILAHVCGAAAGGGVSLPEPLRAADLTAMALAAERQAAVLDLIAASRDVGCPLVLLKGTATALRYYPAPHLRATGDVDVLVSPAFRAEFESRLRSRGFHQRSSFPADAFEGRHHSMPFWHAGRHLWVDVHAALVPRQYPLAGDARFSWPAVASQLTRIPVGGEDAYVMNPELQLVYTSARWAERFDARRGIFPMLDAALVIQRCGATLDWEQVLRGVRGSWAAAALSVMISWLDAHALAPVPPDVLRRVGHGDPHVNGLATRLLSPLITRHIVEGRPFGLLPNEAHVQQMWADLMEPGSFAASLVRIPYHVLCPPRDPQRFNPLFAARRLGSFARRAVRGRAAIRAGTPVC
jgi:hypothetical protein